MKATLGLVLHRFTPFDNFLKQTDSSYFVSHGILYSSDGNHDAVLAGFQSQRYGGRAPFLE